MYTVTTVVNRLTTDHGSPCIAYSADTSSYHDQISSSTSVMCLRTGMPRCVLQSVCLSVCLTHVTIVTVNNGISFSVL